MRAQSLLKSIFGVAFIVLLLPIVSCDAAGNPSALVGRWVGVSGDDKDGVMDLLSDGTGVVTKGSQGVAITWKTESGRFYLTAFGGAQSVSYKQQGSELTFTEDNGKISKYTKCGNKDCKEAAKEYVKAQFAKVKKGSFTDSRDGKSYRTVKLDNQTWMAENLSYNAGGSKCYENQENYCSQYGRLYNWETARTACPKGWHLPSDNEWQILVDLVGGDKAAGNMLKSSIGWNNNGNGIDAIGFAALPGGYGGSGGSFFNVGYYGYWWSSTERSANFAYSRDMGYNIELVGRNYYDKSYLRSVRCLQD